MVHVRNYEFVLKLGRENCRVFFSGHGDLSACYNKLSVNLDITYKTVSTAQPAYLHSALKQFAPSRIDFVHQTVVCWISHVSAHASVLVILLWLLPPPGTLFLFTFVTVPPYLVSAVNSKLFSINQPSTLCSAPPIHPSASDSAVFLRLCALYKFTFLLT